MDPKREQNTVAIVNQESRRSDRKSENRARHLRRHHRKFLDDVPVSPGTFSFCEKPARGVNETGFLSAGSVLIAAVGEVTLERVVNLGCRH